MKAITLKNISSLAKKGTVFIQKGKYGIIEGHDKRQYIKNGPYSTPNFYPWNTIKSMKDFFKVEQ